MLYQMPIRFILKDISKNVEQKYLVIKESCKKDMGLNGIKLQY